MERLLSKRNLWASIIGLHVIILLSFIPTMVAGEVQGDLGVYRHWVTVGFSFGQWPGIDTVWVYPQVALIPMVLAGLAGSKFYMLLWLCMITALNITSFAVLIGRRSSASRIRAAWWWLAIVFILSPVELLRLEGVTAPLVVIALVVLSRQPAVSGVILTLVTWVKVWPVAILFAVVSTSRKWLTVLWSAVATTTVVIATLLMLGGGANLFGFITTQSSRSLQIEAPVATPWMWMSIASPRDYHRYNDANLLTWVVDGPGSGIVSKLMTPLMALAIVGIIILLFRARKRGAAPQDALLTGSLALVSAMIVFNKVGSPQYMLWLAPIVVVGLAIDRGKWLVPANLMMVISIATTLIFPIFYMQLVHGSRSALMLLSVRNVLLVVLLGWAISRLVSLGNKTRVSNDILSDARPQPAMAEVS
jgi:hypothetical protein